jgi:hypothetical protein
LPTNKIKTPGHSALYTKRIFRLSAFIAKISSKTKRMPWMLPRIFLSGLLPSSTTFEHPKPLQPGFSMIAKNCCLDQLNMRKKKFSQLTGIHFQLSEEETDIEEMLALEKMLESLLILFDQLDEKFPDAAFSEIHRKRSIREIANLFNLKESAVKMRLARTRRRLGKMLCLPHIEAVSKKIDPFSQVKRADRLRESPSNKSINSP